jgi:hypothetical protein
LNQTGELISYIDWSTQQNQRIIVKKIDGTAVFEIDYPTKRVITSLDWQNDQEIVMVVKDDHDQKSIVRFHLLNKSEDILIPASITNYGAIAVEAGKILVESPESGIDNIYEVTAQGLRQITSSKFGAYAPTISNSGLIYNNYSVNGMEIASRDEEWSHPAPSNDSFIPFYEKFSSFE